MSTDALKLSLALPHQTLYNDSEVQQVNLPSVNGDLGILANHIPIVEQLRPGLLEIISKTETLTNTLSAAVSPWSNQETS